MAPSLGIIVADFTTQLAADIIIGGTTGTLSSATDDDGVALASGHYFFTIDGGNSAKEHISCDLVGTALTNIKSVSRQGVETTGVVRKHRIGASISITDFAHISKINDVMRGVTALDGTSPLSYDVEPTFTDRKQLISKSYADDVLSGVVGTASDTTSGTIKTTKNQSTKARTKATLVREQNTPDMTLKVESFKLAFVDQNTTFAGGNSPSFINPGLAGDLAISTNPSNTETVTLTINGTACVFTFVSSIGATPGNILIQGTAALTRAALATFIANPGTTNANQVAFTGAQLTAMGLVSSTDDLALNLFIRANSATVTTFTGAETMAGGSNTWTANTTKNRLDLLVLSAGSLAIRKGSEAVSPTIPTPTTGDVVLCSVYNIPGETTIKDKTAALAGYIDEMYDLAVYRTDLATSATLLTVKKFGGDGTDGALTITSGATNVDCAGAQLVVKNYTSISITGTGSLTFTNPHANGTTIVLKSQGDVILTSSATPMIDGRNMGAAGGAAVTAATQTAGNAGNDGVGTIINSKAGAGANPPSVGAGGAVPTMTLNALAYSATRAKYLTVFPGSGGGGGALEGGGGSATTGAIGGRGGAAIVVECAGAWNFTTTNGINVSGQSPAAGADNGTNQVASAGAGGGSGGCFIAMYTTLTANTGTVVVSGGVGGNNGPGSYASNRRGSGGGGYLVAGTAGTGPAGASVKSGGDGAVGYSSITKNTDFA